MTAIPLEKRVSDLERRMAEFQTLLSKPADSRDWRRAVGAFTDDPGMQAILTEAMRLRAANRARSRRGRGPATGRA